MAWLLALSALSSRSYCFPVPYNTTRSLLVRMGSLLFFDPLFQDKSCLGIYCMRDRANKQQLKQSLGLPRWRSGYESACQCRGHGFEPWAGKIPHAVEHLSPCTTTTEPALQSLQATATEAECHNYLCPHAQSLCSATREEIGRAHV